MAHDGEPGEWDAPAPVVLTSNPEKVARVREAIESHGVVRRVEAGFVAVGPLEKGHPVKMASDETLAPIAPGFHEKRFVELEEDASLDPFGMGGTE